jgi:hypothetical protein
MITEAVAVRGHAGAARTNVLMISEVVAVRGHAGAAHAEVLMITGSRSERLTDVEQVHTGPLSRPAPGVDTASMSKPDRRSLRSLLAALLAVSALVVLLVLVVTRTSAWLDRKQCEHNHGYGNAHARQVCADRSAAR